MEGNETKISLIHSLSRLSSSSKAGNLNVTTNWLALAAWVLIYTNQMNLLGVGIATRKVEFKGLQLIN